jgi:hypothetical protein
MIERTDMATKPKPSSPAVRKAAPKPSTDKKESAFVHVLAQNAGVVTITLNVGPGSSFRTLTSGVGHILHAIGPFVGSSTVTQQVAAGEWSKPVFLKPKATMGSAEAALINLATNIIVAKLIMHIEEGFQKMHASVRCCLDQPECVVSEKG